MGWGGLSPSCFAKKMLEITFFTFMFYNNKKARNYIGYPHILQQKKTMPEITFVALIFLQQQKTMLEITFVHQGSDSCHRF